MYRGDHSIRFYPVKYETKPDGPPDRIWMRNIDYIGGCRFDDVHRIFSDWPDTWRTWHLVPTAKPVFEPPKVKENRLEVPGRHGSVDSNRYVHDHPIFAERTGTVEFVIDPDCTERRTDLHSRIVSFFQGRDMLAVLRDDRAYYYKGRFTVSDIKPGEWWDTIALNYELEPFKYDRWYGAEVTKEASGGSAEKLERPLEITTTGAEYILTRGTEYIQPLKGYEHAQTPMKGQTLFLAAGETVILSGGQTVPDDFGEMDLEGNQNPAADPTKWVRLKDGHMVLCRGSDDPADPAYHARIFNPGHIFIDGDTVRAAMPAEPSGTDPGSSGADPGSSGTDDGDDYIPEDCDPAKHTPFGVVNVMLPGLDATWKGIAIPDGCFATPEFKWAGATGFAEASVDEGVTWHAVGSEGWEPCPGIRLATKLWLRGNGKLKVRFRGGWL